jgi:hypothetical protein
VALSLITPAVLAGALAAAIAFAPTALADNDDDASITDRSPRGTTSQPRERANDVPKGWTNEALWSQPGTGPSADKIFGTLPKPPIYALD